MDEPRTPLQDEAERRAEWRGEDEAPRPEAGGHTLPASEDDDERMGSGGDEDAVSHPGTMPPPD